MSDALPRVKTALLEAFEAHTTLAALSPTWGHPGPDNITREALFIDRGRGEEEWHTLGESGSVNVPPGLAQSTPTRRETVEVEVVVIVRREQSEHLVEVRAWEIVDDVRSAIRQDVTLGGNVDWAGVVRTEQTSFADGTRGVIAQVVLTVEAQARV